MTQQTPLEQLTQATGQYTRRRSARPIKGRNSPERFYRGQLRQLIAAMRDDIQREVMPIIRQEKADYRTMDSPPNNGYVSVRPDAESAKMIFDHMQSLGIDGAIPDDELHVTLMYSSTGIPLNTGVHAMPDREYSATVMPGFEIIGNDPWRALVIDLSSDELSARHRELLAAGAKHSYPEFRAHMSLKYSPTDDDLQAIKQNPFPADQIKLTGEAWKPIKPKTTDAAIVQTKDSWSDRLIEAMNRLITKYTGDLFNAQYRRLAARTVSMADAESTQAFVKSVNKAVGVDLTPMLSSEGMRDYLDVAIEQNVQLIKSVSEEHLKRIENAVLGGVRGGDAPSTIARNIQEATGISMRRARFIARDQAAKLAGEITERRQRQSGVTHFRWVTSKDERVGSDHRRAAQRDVGFGPGVYRWDKPPQEGVPGNATRPNCRCTATPIFEWELPEGKR